MPRGELKLMAYTPIQTLRKMRALAKGRNIKLAASLRKTADILDKKGREEFSRTEIACLGSLPELLKARLDFDAKTSGYAKFVALTAGGKQVNKAFARYRAKLHRKKHRKKK
jgi:hypothetical protein